MLKTCIPAATFTVLFVTATAPTAAPISVEAFGLPFEVFHLRDFRGPNSVGFTEGDRLVLGAVNVVPNGKGEDNGVFESPDVTTGVARQGSTEIVLFDTSTTIFPNEMAVSTNYDPSLTGSWELEFTNGPDTLIVNTPEVGTTVGLPIVRSLKFVGGDITTPTFEWEDPGNADTVVVSIFDLNRVSPGAGADRIFESAISGDSTSFTVPDGELEEEGRYAFAVRPALLRTSGTNPSGSSQAGSIISQSTTFFEFSTSSTPLPPGAFLPQVSVSSGTPVFNFNNPVIANMIEFYDPFVAIGYDYRIGEGDPNFASFILPEIGDDLFDLYLFDDSMADYVFQSSIGAGVEYFFEDEGVSRFRILGIETTAGLSPTDGTAFVTGLSFVEDGRFTGTMTPITTFAEDTANVPLPASFPMLLLSALTLFGVSRYRAA